MAMMCWSEYEEWMEEQYTEAAAAGLEAIAVLHGVQFVDASGTVVEERDAPEGMSDKAGRC